MDVPVRMDEQAEEPLRIVVDEPSSDLIVVRLYGDLDLLTAPLLHDRLMPLLDQADRVLVVDLGGVAFLGSAGLSALVAARATADGNSVRMVLVASSRAVLRPLEVTGLHTLFQIFDTTESAIRGL